MGEISGDRRAGRRYRLELPLRYRVLQKNQPVGLEGVGITRNMSSAGVSFEADAGIPPNAVVEIWISWPSSGDSGRVELHAVGAVVRTERSEVGVRMKRHEFVTVQAGAKPAGSGESGGGLRAAQGV